MIKTYKNDSKTANIKKCQNHIKKYQNHTKKSQRAKNCPNCTMTPETAKMIQNCQNDTQIDQNDSSLAK